MSMRHCKQVQIVMLEAYQKLNLYDIANEFKNDMVEANHKFSL
jgi:hypothetical protein